MVKSKSFSYKSVEKVTLFEKPCEHASREPQIDIRTCILAYCKKLMLLMMTVLPRAVI